MLAPVDLYTLDAFFDFIAQRNGSDADPHFEYIGGEIVEVVSSGYPSRIAMRIGRYIDAFVDEHNLGRVTGADGGYMVNGEAYIPDVAFTRFESQAEAEYRQGYNVQAPDLAVEVLSPSDVQRERRTTTKVVNYLQAGTLVWLVDPEARTVTVYALDAKPRILTSEDRLDGGAILPGFAVPVAKLFPVE